MTALPDLSTSQRYARTAVKATGAFVKRGAQVTAANACSAVNIAPRDGDPPKTKETDAQFGVFVADAASQIGRGPKVPARFSLLTQTPR